MKIRLSFILMLLLTLSVLATSANASPVGDFFRSVGGFFYTPAGGEYTATDAFDNELTFDRAESEHLTTMTATGLDTYLQGKFKAGFPGDYVGTATEDIKGIDGDMGDLRFDVSDKGRQTTAFIDTIIPGSGTALNGLLALGGTLASLFYRHKGNRQERLNLATGRDINDIRDMLDYLPSEHQKVGMEIDTRIKEILSGAHAQAKVTSEAGAMVREVKSVTKRPLTL